MKSVKFLTKIISDGRITIPQPLREYMNIKDGDLIQCEISEVK